MRKVLIACAVLLLTVSCTKAMRYTDDEIRQFKPEMQERIKTGEVATGMTYVQVRYAWGAPGTVNVLPPGEDGIEKIEWIYKTWGGMFKTYLRFKDGKLAEIISSGH